MKEPVRTVTPEPFFSKLQYYLLLGLFIVIPLTATTLTYNRSDLPKFTALMILGGVFILLSLTAFCIKYSPVASSKNGIIIEYDKTFDPFILLFMVAAILSTIFSINQRVSFFGQYERQIGLVTFTYIAVIYFFAAPIFRDGGKIARVFQVIEITALIVSIHTFLQNFNIDPLGLQNPNVDRQGSTLGNAVFAGGFLAVVLPFSVFNISGKTSLVLKIIFPLVIFSAIIITRTRSAYLALIAQLLVFILLYFFAVNKSDVTNKKKFKLAAIILGAILIVIIIISVLAPNNAFTQRILSIADPNNPRWILWRDSFNIFKKYPFFGPGIASFPMAIEEFYSFELRTTDVKRYFDHAHNNFLHALFTMGIVGFAAYVLIVFQAFKSCIKKLFSKEADHKTKIIFLTFLMMISGYSVYGLTNFDEITILFYFFMFIGMLSAFYSKGNLSKFTIKKGFIKPAMALSLIAAIGLGYNIYNSVNWFSADTYFLKGTMMFNQKMFAEGVLNYNNAIIRNINCPTYRYMLANNVYKIAASTEKMAPESKNHLLKQAADETIKAREGYFNKNECDLLLSLIYYELGRTAEADSIKNNVLVKNPVNIAYRLSLALYYIKKEDFRQAWNNIDTAYKFHPNSLEVLTTAAYCNMVQGNSIEAKKYCDMILNIDPGNHAAREFLKQIK